MFETIVVKKITDCGNGDVRLGVRFRAQRALRFTRWEAQDVRSINPNIRDGTLFA
jgi:hypothetical protein